MRPGVAQYGRADGLPVFYFHGLPGSRLEASLADRAAREAGVRIVSLDRPGIGRSPFREEREISDFAADTERAADALGIGTFAVLGVSGGAPYALACGIRLRERVTRVGLVCPAAPFAETRYRAVSGWKLRIVLSLAGSPSRRFRKPLAAAARIVASHPERCLLLLAKVAGSRDREVILANLPLFAANLREAFRGGADGPMRDAELLFRPWGFQPSETPQPVLLWHGGRDRTIPQAVGVLLSREIPRCRSFFPPWEGHFSLAVGSLEEILSTLAERA